MNIWKTTKNINFNLYCELVIILRFVENENNTLLKEIIDFGFKNREESIRIVYQIQTVGTFISLLSNYKNEMRSFVKQHIYDFRKGIFRTRDKKYIAGFIAIIHRISPKEAIKDLFEPYKTKFPNDVKIIGDTYFYLGKNYLEQQNIKEAKYHLTRAKTHLKNLEGRENTLFNIETLLEEIKNQPHEITKK